MYFNRLRPDSARALITSILGRHLNVVKVCEGEWTTQNSVVHLSFTITLKIDWRTNAA